MHFYEFLSKLSILDTYLYRIFVNIYYPFNFFAKNKSHFLNENGSLGLDLIWAHQLRPISHLGHSHFAPSLTMASLTWVQVVLAHGGLENRQANNFYGAQMYV